jgi:hypothetical protein
MNQRAKTNKAKTAPPQYQTLQYRFEFQNSDARHYKLIDGTFEKMPNELIIEKIRSAATVEATMYARSPQLYGRHSLKTGIRPLSNCVAYGDQFEYENGSKVNHFLLFVFSTDRQFLTVYHFLEFNPYRKTEFVKSFLKTQKKGLIL